MEKGFSNCNPKGCYVQPITNVLKQETFTIFIVCKMGPFNTYALMLYNAHGSTEPTKREAFSAPCSTLKKKHRNCMLVFFYRNTSLLDPQLESTNCTLVKALQGHSISIQTRNIDQTHHLLNFLPQ